MDQIWMCVHNFTLTVNDTFRSAAETRKDVNNLNEITKHMEANVSKDVMHGLDQKLYHLQLEVQGGLGHDIFVKGYYAWVGAETFLPST